ncbi:hypothetical protein BHE90_010078 [Fusarium euwallaceae]|uniref:asparaginase n=1 Tax=Fusarium euwallaceae TaxID=1147111 RepID=A0A430LIA7_9HYPO|nr:hypothetical protein BHE90_010078 [Fusarium euwallaceae]
MKSDSVDPLPNITIIATGGTIAGAADSPEKTTDYEAGALHIDDITEGISGEWRNDAIVRYDQLMNVDSLDIDSSRAIRISQHVTEAANDPQVQGIVLLIGTDLLSEVAVLLALTVTSHKPIVMIGAILPHTAVSADGPGNILAAVRTAAAKGWSSKGHEVVIVIQNKIMAPWGTKKENNQFLPGPRSLLGEIEDSRPCFRWSPDPRAYMKFDLGGLSPGTPLPEVVRFDAHQDFRAYLVEAAIANGAKGIVLVGYGDGYWPEASAQQIKKLADETGVVMVFAAEGQLNVCFAKVPDIDKHTVISLRSAEVIPSAIRKRSLDDLLTTGLLYQHIPSTRPIRSTASSLVSTTTPRTGPTWAMAKKHLPEEINAESQRDDTGPPRKKNKSRDIVRSGVSFDDLSLEIRRMIWEWAFYPALESRIYNPGALLKGVESYYPDYQHGMPQSLRVCKEARNVAYRKREWVRIWQDGDQKPIHALVDPERDALYYDSNRNIGGGFEEIEHVFATIIINLRRDILSVILLREWSTMFALSPRLKKIQVVCLAYDWEIPRSSVGTANNFLIFDLDEKTDIQWLLELRSLHPDSKISYHVDPCSETSDTSASETSDTSASEMSDHSVSEMFDHSDTKISWEVVDADIRCLQKSSLPLYIVDGTKRAHRSNVIAKGDWGSFCVSIINAAEVALKSYRS